jgi:hypothetical protein
METKVSREIYGVDDMGSMIEGFALNCMINDLKHPPFGVEHYMGI